MTFFRCLRAFYAREIVDCGITPAENPNAPKVVPQPHTGEPFTTDAPGLPYAVMSAANPGMLLFAVAASKGKNT